MREYSTPCKELSKVEFLPKGEAAYLVLECKREFGTDIYFGQILGNATERKY